ncbi:Uncharacterised protein [Mycobacteroides abscessus subsp. abscessus]|nr:Uncharacterised protein [Mycobacteroides abscessus subsp. abscessus]
MRARVAMAPVCGRLRVMISLSRCSSTLRSPTTRVTGPLMREASHPAVTSSAGSVASPETTAELMPS